MKVKSVTPQNGEYVEIEWIEDGETFTTSYLRFSPTSWEIDWEDDFRFEPLHHCHEIEQAYQEFISNRKDAIS